MNISMYTIYALMQNFKTPVDAFRHFYDKGIRYADIVDEELERLPLHLYCQYLREGGLQPEALVSMLDTAAFSKEKREKNISSVKGYIDQMEKLSIPILMLAPSVRSATNENEFKKMKELLIDGFSKIVEYAQDCGVTVAIENQSVLTRADSRALDIRKILDSVNGLKFVLDAGNFFCIGEDVLTAYEQLKDKMVHMHIKDWKYDMYGNFVRENIPRFEGTVIGNGILPLKELFEKLRTDKYKGNAVLEINSGNITLEMLDASADFLRSEINA